MFGVAIDLASAALVVWLGATILARQFPSELRRALLLTHAAALLFTVGDLGTLLAVDVEQETLALAILYAGTMSLPPCLLLLATVFAGSHERPATWVPRRAVGVAFGLAAAFWLAAATNPWHGHFLTPVMGGRNEHHWLWWVASTVSYAVVCLSIAVCVWLGSRRDLDRTAMGQAAVLATAMAVPIIANGVYNLTDWSSRIDPSVPAFSVTVALVALGIHGVGLFGLSPVSMREALLATAEAVLVVDPRGRERIANAAARALMDGSPQSTHDAVARLATSLLHSETDEEVAGAELWALAQAIPEKRTGGLYRTRAGGEEPARWLWLSARPVRSRWREVAAYYFRATDVTALETLRRDNAALVHWASQVNDMGPASENNAGRGADRAIEGTSDWRTEILHRLENHEMLSVPGISARRVGALLDEILRDPEAVAFFERVSPEEAWREFERRLAERDSPD